MAEVVLALDVGEARIGVARGEVGSRLVFGRGALRRGRQAETVAEVASLVLHEGAARVVVGLPRRSDGGDSKQTQRVRAFARALAEAGLTVVFEDERYTTQLADRRRRDGAGNHSSRRDKGRLDEAAAMLILESYLARTESGAEPGSDLP